MRTLKRTLPALLLLSWALSHADGGDTPKGKGDKGGRPPAAKDVNTVERIRAALDQTMPLDFSGQSIMEALQHLREKSGVEFNLDQVAIQMMGINIDNNGPDPIAMKGNTKLSNHLRKLLKNYQLAYVIYEDSVLITSTELATQRQMRQTVNFEVNEQPLAKALKELAKNYAVCLVIDPRIGDKAQNKVSLSVDGASLETGVRLLSELAGLKAVRMDNVLFVTDEVRADKIRKEEKDLAPGGLDDLLDPRIPGRAIGLNALGIPGPAFRAVPLPPKAEENAVPPKDPLADPPPPPKKDVEKKDDKELPPKAPPAPPRTDPTRFDAAPAVIASRRTPTH